MSNILYDFGRQGILDGSIQVASASIRTALVSSTYTPNTSADEFLSTIPGAAIVATSDPLSGVSETAGVFRANNAVINSVPTGHTIAYLVLYEDSGVSTTSRLIALIDTATGLPYSTNGGSITIAWDTGPNGIFKI